MTVNPHLTRKTVSYQGNRLVPGLRWMKYKEGFSRGLVEHLIDEFHPSAVLDPFAGIGTTPLIAAGKGLSATGIEIMPVGVLVGRGIAHAANGLSETSFKTAGSQLLDAVKSNDTVPQEYSFPHVRITEAAFPNETESAIAIARAFIDTVEDDAVRGSTQPRLHDRTGGR